MQENEFIAAIAALEASRAELAANLRSIEDALAYLKKSHSSPVVQVQLPKNGHSANGSSLHGTKVNAKIYSDYNPRMTIREKVLIILKHENRFLHVREAEAIIKELEGRYRDKDIGKMVYSGFSGAKKTPGSGIISKTIDKTAQDTFYGSEKWLDEAGNIKRQFMYREDQLTKNRKKDEVIV